MIFPWEEANRPPAIGRQERSFRGPVPDILLRHFRTDERAMAVLIFTDMKPATTSKNRGARALGKASAASGPSLPCIVDY